MILKNPVIRKILGKVEINTIIRKMEGKKLKQTEKNYLYRAIRPKLIAASLLTNAGIIKKINTHQAKDTSLIDYNLSLYGYKMILPKKLKKSRKISIEELIAEIIIHYPKARYLEAIPIIMAKNQINKFKLLELAAMNGIKNKIGYLLETAIMLKPSFGLKDVLSYLEENKDKEFEFLADGDYDFLMKNSPARVLKWNLLGRFFDDDFKRNAKAQL